MSILCEFSSVGYVRQWVVFGLVSYPDPQAAADGLHHRYASTTNSRSGDVIHPQLRCGSGYETLHILEGVDMAFSLY